jgi:hypothetical protein
MTIIDFLCGPFGCGDYWVRFNRGDKERWAERWGVGPREVLSRFVALYDPAERPPVEKLDLLKRWRLLGDGGLKVCMVAFDVVNKTFHPDIRISALIGVYNIAHSDALFDGLARHCTMHGAKPTVLDHMRVDVDVGERATAEEILRTAQAVKARLARYGIDAAFMYSGAKGFHLWFTFEEPVPAEYRPDLVKAVAEIAETAVDTQAMDVARRLRTPYTVNLKTGQRARFFDPDTGSWTKFTWPKPLTAERIKQLVVLGRDLKIESRCRSDTKTGGEIATRGVPRWVRRLIDYMCETGELCHYARVAVVRSLLVAGWGVEQVVDLFKRCAKDFDERRTRYHVEYEKRRLDAGEKPWRCSTVEQHCAGRDIPGALCKNS